MWIWAQDRRLWKIDLQDSVFFALNFVRTYAVERSKPTPLAPLIRGEVWEFIAPLIRGGSLGVYRAPYQGGSLEVYRAPYQGEVWKFIAPLIRGVVRRFIAVRYRFLRPMNPR